MIVWDVDGASARRDARGPRRAGHGLGDHRFDPVLERPGRQGPRLGSRRRPSPRARVLGRAGQPGGPALRPEPRRPRPRDRTARRDRGADRRPNAAGALALCAWSPRARSAAWGMSRAAGCSSSAATTASSRSSTRGAARSPSACPATAARSTRPASAPTDGSWPRPAPSGSCSMRCRRDDPSGRPFAGSSADHGRVAQPRRPHAGHHATTVLGCRDPRRAHAPAAARPVRSPRPCGTTRASRPTGASSWAEAGRAGRSCGRPRRGSPSVAGSPATPAAWNGSRSAPTAAPSPPAARTAPSGSGTCAGSNRSPPRCPACRTGRSSRSSRPTVRTCSRSTAKAGGRTAGTCARPLGRSTRVRSPAARSRGRVAGRAARARLRARLHALT